MRYVPQNRHRARGQVSEAPGVVLAFARKLGIVPFAAFPLAVGLLGVALPPACAGAAAAFEPRTTTDTCLPPLLAAAEPAPAVALPCCCCWPELVA